MKPIVKISFTILFLFSFFGMLIFGDLIHELSHKQDLGNFVSNGSICYLKFDNGAYWASYNYQVNNYSEYNQIAKYTEWKAYALNVIIIVLYFGCFYFIIINRMEEEDRR